MGKNKGFTLNPRHLESQRWGSGRGDDTDEMQVRNELMGRIPKNKWGDLPKSCVVEESDGKLREISVPGELPGTRRVIIVQKK